MRKEPKGLDQDGRNTVLDQDKVTNMSLMNESLGFNIAT